jgi:hypothetical protein
MDALWWLVLIAVAIVVVVGALFLVRRARRAGTVLASRAPSRSDG